LFNFVVHILFSALCLFPQNLFNDE